MVNSYNVEFQLKEIFLPNFSGKKLFAERGDIVVSSLDHYPNTYEFKITIQTSPVYIFPFLKYSWLTASFKLTLHCRILVERNFSAQFWQKNLLAESTDVAVSSLDHYPNSYEFKIKIQTSPVYIFPFL
jgi:hypothetical protein